jgi:hypothetical protein
MKIPLFCYFSEVSLLIISKLTSEKQMKYLTQTENITEEKNKDLDYGRVVLNKEDNSVYLLGYGWKFKWIDLGLPSGTLWMDRNIGATSVEDAGLYFAWGETDGYTADEVGTKKNFNWDDYKYANGAYNKLTKYCNKSSYGNDGFTDNLTELELSDDAAYAYTNGKAKMPTKEQIVEIMKETDVYLIKTDGTEIHGTYVYQESSDDYMIVWDSEILELFSGIEFRRKSDNSIKVFVPCAGFGYEGSVGCVGFRGQLWSSSLDEVDPYPDFPWTFGLGIDNCKFIIWNDGIPRTIGCSVRGVKA